ncbi:hypothetical protein SKAU_G00282500 [Synaphobranchus kaupii]|uniref:Uncharacterized protein n=1 Tax=Synaphobranchus kaupii TaxID=118154 RepID=A0A9Q1EXB4_SYNKA|nr:hypothetical protein SKAU_G00282500 [Synaphobranchus kaupii]
MREEFDPWHVAKGIKKKTCGTGKQKGQQGPNGLDQIHQQPFLVGMLIVWWEPRGTETPVDFTPPPRLWSASMGRRWRRAYMLPKAQRTNRRKDDSTQNLRHSRLCSPSSQTKDLEEMTHFKHTGSLEVYHSAMLKYLPKRLHFGFQTMTA